MQELKIFKSEEFGRVRTLIINNMPYFVGKDVAIALDYKDTSDALKRHIQPEDKLTRCFTDSGQKRNMTVINESGLYSLIFGSKLETAKKFKRWVTSEVLPAIRKTGTYSIDTTFQYPVTPAAMESATNAGRLLEKVMRNEGIPPHIIAMAIKSIFQQAGIELPEYVVRIPAYEQYELPIS